MKSGLENRVVLITGASGGIGAACARELAEEGAHLVLHAHRGRDRAEALADQLETETMIATADLGREADCESLFAAALDHFGRLDGVVANAGIWEPEAVPIKDLSLERFERYVAANQTSVFLTAREYFRHLDRARPEDASLVLVGSTAAVFGEEGHAEYAATKAAVVYGLTRTLKNEIVRLVPRGRVNAVCPGWVRTPMAADAMDDPEAVSRAMQTRSIRAIAEPEEIARTITFLLSPRLSSHMTGEILTVSAGMEGRLLHGDGARPIDGGSTSRDA